MPGNSFGELFRITTWGESHGGGVGVVVDGCPPRLPLTVEDIQPDLERRRPGQSRITTQRQEADTCEILSGTFQGLTLGTPISIWVRNTDARPEAYSEMAEMFRPSHADFAYQAKYGVRNWEGGGRSSARETIGRVAGAAVAKVMFHDVLPKLRVVAYVKSIHSIEATVDPLSATSKQVESNIVRCPDAKVAKKMIECIEAARASGDSVGGVIECAIQNVPAGLGEPVFDRFEADLAKGMLSLPATKGFEIGSGFAGTVLKGSEHNDAFRMKSGRVVTPTNRSGGVLGGITSAQPIIFRVAFKATATIAREQETVSVAMKNAKLKARGRHDPCVLPRAVPLVEAMSWLVLADHWLRWKAQCL